MSSEWFEGNIQIATYQLNELMGTKFRALYQRKKGRDLFDLWYVLQNNLVDTDIILDVFTQHSDYNAQSVTRAMFEKSLNEKRQDLGFASDMQYLIHPAVQYNFDHACDFVGEQLIARLPGEQWKV